MLQWCMNIRCQTIEMSFHREYTENRPLSGVTAISRIVTILISLLFLCCTKYIQIAALLPPCIGWPDFVGAIRSDSKRTIRWKKVVYQKEKGCTYLQQLCGTRRAVSACRFGWLPRRAAYRSLIQSSGCTILPTRFLCVRSNHNSRVRWPCRE